MCDFTAEEIEAIAEHEHIPEMLAIEMAEYWIHTPGGLPRIRRIILEDIEHARAGHEPEKVQRLEMVLKYFIATHPEHAPTPNDTSV
jgi:hypothetical protein